MNTAQLFTKNFLFAALLALLLVLITPYTAWSQSGISLQPTPDNGIHPRMFQDANGVVHLLYFRKRSASPRSREGDLFYRQFDAVTQDWGSATRVSSQSFNYADPIYRANFAVDGEGRIHAVWYQSRPSQFFYTRSNPQRTEFEPRRTMVSDNLEGVDAGADIAAQDDMVAIVWGAGALTKEDERTVFTRVSSDYGATFSSEEVIGDKRLGACACCSLATEFNQQNKLLVAYRSAIGGVGRHMQLLSVDPLNASPSQASYADVFPLQEWELSACPVSTNDFAKDYQQNAWLVFETESRIIQMNTSTNAAPSLVAEPLTRTRQKHPDIAFSSDGYKLIVWAEGISFTRGGTLNWQLFDDQGKPVVSIDKPEIIIQDNSSPAAVVTPAGSFLILY